ncbi:hypothetical protein LSS_20184 [Leptospira santarosai serovar Shermani str. LT 821]|uniref:Uncharacterized protein n=2 Tax=Leptospira santarosai TaxID=28183 RepID=K8Y552_9LEPT|nr:hypothetical protein LSS_20184 [Leptospira santarosai serovar Shermani str. LT 821]
MEIITETKMEKNMRLIILTVIACLSLNCFIGSHRDACKYNLHESISSSYCKFIGTATASTNPNMDANTLQKRDQILTFELLNCYQYYEKLKECNKEEYKYMPAIYGMNLNPYFSVDRNRVAFRE